VTDENGHRSIPIPDEKTHGSSYIEAASEMGNSAIRNMAPAEKGWILAASIIILGAIALLEVTNYLEQVASKDSMSAFFMAVEQNRAEENRRLQEQNRILAQAIARQSDRKGRREVEEGHAEDIENARSE